MFIKNALFLRFLNHHILGITIYECTPTVRTIITHVDGLLSNGFDDISFIMIIATNKTSCYLYLNFVKASHRTGLIQVE